MNSKIIYCLLILYFVIIIICTLLKTGSFLQTHEKKKNKKISLKYNNNISPPRLKINGNKEVNTVPVCVCVCVFFFFRLRVYLYLFVYLARKKNNIDADGLQVVLCVCIMKKYASCLEFANENEN